MCSWWGLGVWIILATYYTAPCPVWVAYALPVGIAALYYFARREAVRLNQWPALCALAASAAACKTDRIAQKVDLCPKR
jgi:hypothetical protein